MRLAKYVLIKSLEEYLMPEEVQFFDPTLHDFSYMLSKYDCFRKLSGKCSLLLNEKELMNYSNNEKPLKPDEEYSDRKENSVHYCRLLLKNFEEKGIQYSIDINPHSCKHFSFSDGQHRTCIAKTAGINDIPANIHEAWDSECRVCYFKKTNLVFRIRHMLNKTDEFTR
jgi:hypothetical protein